LLLGLIAFAAVTGGAIIFPRNTAWLMHDDLGQEHLGWRFYRQAPLWQIPPGANPGYGAEMGSSIV
jgi:hypothetical protein